MESFLGILFCGGKGVRLGRITEYVSKAFVPVDDRPVFMYPLAQLEASQRIDEIMILTNVENDARLRQTGYRTLIQDDAQVRDMFSGLAYIRKVIGDDRSTVLMPCDNISDIEIDLAMQVFLSSGKDIGVCLTEVDDRHKLAEMGVWDPDSQELVYKPQDPPSDLGVITPYFVRRGVDLGLDPSDLRMNDYDLCMVEHSGYWFDIGDVPTWHRANRFLRMARQ